MQKIYRLGLILLCAVVLINCADFYNVKHQSDKDYDYSRLKIYQWLDVDVETGFDKNVGDLMRAAVDRELRKKGYQEVEKDPDFRVFLYIHKKEAVTYETSGPTLGNIRQIEQVRYEEGNIVVDFMNAKPKIVFWSGTVSGKLYKDPLTPAEQEKRINDGIGRMLKPFPSRAK